MFCKKCGAELDDNAKFCAKCGTKTEVGEAASVQAAAPTPNPVNVNQAAAPTSIPVSATTAQKSKSGSFIAIIIAIALGIIALIVIAVIGIKATRKIDLNDYIIVEYEGYNTHGTASWRFDSESFEEDYGSKLKFDTKKLEKELQDANFDYLFWYGEGFLKATGCEWAEEMIGGSLENSTQLSNGDEITFAWNDDDILEVEEYFNYKFKYSDITVEVSGLEELQNFDPFDGVSLIYTGFSPNGNAEVQKSANSGVYQYISYNMDKSSGLSNGDVITVTASYGYGSDLADYTAENFGMLPSQLTKEYTVEGLGYYASKLSDIPEETLAAMQQQGVDILTASAASWDEHVSLSGISYIGSYLLVAKDSSTSWDKNEVVLVFKVTTNVDCDDPDTHDMFSYYYALSFYDIVVLPDGVVSVDLSNYNKTSDRFGKEYDFGGWWTTTIRWEGYEKLDSLFNKKVTANLEAYSYESSVTEQ